MKVLIVSYKFCPKGLVGTRRWSKFAKYLANLGYEVHVICAKYPYKDKVNWCHDVENNLNIIIHRIDARYPSFILRQKRTFWVKLLDRIFQNTLYGLGVASQWGSVLIPFAKELIEKEGIKNVVVTAGPTMPIYFMAKVKNELPHINLILDIRDPWEMHLKTGNPNIDKRRLQRADKKEHFAYQAADTVIFVTKHRAKDAAIKYPDVAQKFKVIYNGFDTDDFEHLNIPPVNDLSVVYPGSLMTERVEAIKLMVKAIAELNDEYVNSHLKVDLYSHNFIPPTFEDKQLQVVFERHFFKQPLVSAKEIFDVMAQHEFCFSINAQLKTHANTIGAKTFDYMGLGKKILLIAPEGELSHILREREQFVCDYNLEQMKATLLKMKAASIQKIPSSNKDYQEFELGNLTQQLLTYFK